MSGIVSLLFCGITLKHYAYHTMSRRTQRATKYTFSILAQLTENFIFIYLGLSLFTSPPVGSKVTSYFKPLFIIISTISVIFVRYASVFPLSEAINFFQRHVRGQRTDEIPYSYQMMLFWAGLRGAVGVALAAGFQGENAQVLRTTVLTVVVLTVVLFGGTTARMLEILGIRTGVEDDAASSDEEDSGAVISNRWLDRRNGSVVWGRYRDDDQGGRPSQYQAQLYNHHMQSTRAHARSASSSLPYGQAQNIFSASSDEDLDSDSGEVLPLATPPHASGTGGPSRSTSLQQLDSEGKWFQALDERYLLPLFSNATASRTFHARRQRRTSAQTGTNGQGSAGEGNTPAESEDEGGQEVDLRRGGISGSPWLATARPERNGSPSLRSPREPEGSDGKFGS